MTQHPDEMLNTTEAARLLGGLHPLTLAAWRSQNRGPAYVKLGDKPRSPVRYWRSTLEQYLKDRTQQLR
jgi:hypothetical protein